MILQPLSACHFLCGFLCHIKMCVDITADMTLLTVVVPKDQQRSGVAQMLLRHLEQHAQQLGAARIVTDVATANTAALQLLMKCGYELATAATYATTSHRSRKQVRTHGKRERRQGMGSNWQQQQQLLQHAKSVELVLHLSSQATAATYACSPSSSLPGVAACMRSQGLAEVCRDPLKPGVLTQPLSRVRLTRLHSVLLPRPLLSVPVPVACRYTLHSCHI